MSDSEKYLFARCPAALHEAALRVARESNQTLQGFIADAVSAHVVKVARDPELRLSRRANWSNFENEVERLTKLADKIAAESNSKK